MTTDGVSFRARARTIDHLGRGQIADAPTAISELWKNAYDAYAKNVALHIFGGSPDVAAILDDGVGMDQADVLERWLVVGTESKIENFDRGPPDTLGLPLRERQGEKGIGRLSVAFLAPGTILISKRKDEKFVVVVVDWRLFENPFVTLEDIKLPVQAFGTLAEIMAGLPDLLKILRQNLGDDKSERGKRLMDGWERFSAYEVQQKALVSTANEIVATWAEVPITERHIQEWYVSLELSDHGTAMFMVDLNHELGVWVRPSETGDEVDVVKDRLRQTLTGFTDPFTEPRPAFDYEVLIHSGDDTSRLLSASDIFGLNDLHELEHYIDGQFDERGRFAGRIVAFGQDLGIKTFIPKRAPPSKGKDRLGPFAFTIGTFEVDERRSTHPEQQHAFILAQAEKFAGVSLYRDGLRVMPYGRPDADFLGMEERRSKNAGREFWAHRRSFGRIGVSRSANASLKDKAGREGLVDNRAFRELRLLVVDFLMDAARKYFGSDSPIREELLPSIMERKAQQKEAATQARQRRTRTLRQFIREQKTPLEETITKTDSLIALAGDTLQRKDPIQATVLAARIQDVRKSSENLRPPLPTSRMGDFEGQWREYRDDYQSLMDRLQTLDNLAAEVESAMAPAAPASLVENRREQDAAYLQEQLNRYFTQIDANLSNLRRIWSDQRDQDSNLLPDRTSHLLTTAVNQGNVLSLLNIIDANRAELQEVFASRYPPFINTLEQLSEGIDLGGAYAITEDDRADLEDQLKDIRAVAQVGITVEIIGHEFETLEAEVRRNLAKLPIAIRESDPFRQAMRAHQSLADRLRFLTPLKIGGYRSREEIRGRQIAEYIEDFFSEIFRGNRIEFSASPSFRDITIRDIPSRIYPVFINLVNNAVYWVSLGDDRRIQLSFERGVVIVGDSGPGVDPEDVDRIFDIFFSRRRSGRGVGLYLTRANLAVAGHKIRYAAADDPKVLPGANFIIDFRGVSSDG